MNGWWRLFRSALRRDRVLLPAWVVSIALMVAFSGSSIKELYPTQAQRDRFAASIEDNAALIAIRGPARGLDTLGGQVAWQVGWFAMVAAALMSLLLVVRHTRADEEQGRTELLLATPLGRLAPLAAALAVALVANCGIFVVTVLALAGVGVPVAGTVVLAASIALCGVFFAAIAGLTAQLGSTSRAASGIAGGVLGAAYLIRALGDARDSDVSKLSPIGLAQAMRPYDGNLAWPGLLMVVVTGLIGALAFGLLERRDVGAGLIRPRPGPARAADSLRSPLGLAARLQRASLGWWATGLFVMGLVYGSIAQDVGDLLDTSTQVEDIFIRGSKADVIDAFLATTSLILALIATGFMISAVLRLHTEEAAGRAEPVLATATSRFAWVGSHGLVGLVGSALLLAVAGAGVGLAYGLQGAGLRQVPRLAVAGLAQAPAVWLVGGIGLLIYGLVPRLSSLVWAVLAWCVLVGLMAPVLGLPQWLAQVSPYDHIPQVPADSLTILPLLVVTAVAAALWVAGFAAVRRRDLV